MRSTTIAIALLSLWINSSFATPNLARPPQLDCQAGAASFKAENCFAAVGQLSNCLAMSLPSPARAWVLQMRAQCYSKLKKPDQALQDQNASLQLDSPKDVWPLVMLGVYYRELKQYEASLAALKEALKYDEDGPGTGPGMAVYYHTGQTLHQAGRYAEAIEAYTLGIPKQPDYGYALYRRALAYEAIGDKEQAKRDLYRAAELAPKEGYEDDIKDKLSEYGLSAKRGAP